ncbi:DNA methyltransferase [Paraburkholderia hospita]|uniref:DNA methyltransferase n=1 Tax=Paraburkholderia hospita TaxID=169430 RepID=UPI003898DBF4
MQIARSVATQTITTPCYRLLGILLPPFLAPKGRVPQLARVAIWIGEIQWMIDHGFQPSRNPLLKNLNQVHCEDALLDIPEDNTANKSDLMRQWPACDAIVGNPPFIGDKLMRAKLGHEYTEALRSAYEGQVPPGADLVCYWFAKSRGMIEAGRASRAGLVATNSIRQGTNRKVLDAIVSSGRIYDAWEDLNRPSDHHRLHRCGADRAGNLIRCPLSARDRSAGQTEQMPARGDMSRRTSGTDYAVATLAIVGSTATTAPVVTNTISPRSAPVTSR